MRVHVVSANTPDKNYFFVCFSFVGPVDPSPIGFQRYVFLDPSL